jgi:hypothetical protein
VTLVGRGCGCLVDGESLDHKLLVKVIPGHYVVEVNLNMAIFIMFYTVM